MNGRKLLTLLLSATLILALFAGCGAASSDTAYNGKGEISYESAVESPMDSELGRYDSGTQTGEVKVSEQKLIKTVNITTETEDLDQSIAALDQQIVSLGGYVEKREIYNGSSYSGYRQSRRAVMTVRIPVENLSQMVSHVQGSTNVTEYNETIDDVTLAYVDTESRMKALQTEHDRLLELLEKADNMADLLTIEERLTEVRYSLESITSQLRTYDNKIAYSTVHLYVDEVREYTPVEEETVGQRISGGFMNSLKNLWSGIVDFVVFLLVASPYLVFLALLGAGVAGVVVLFTRKNRRKKNVQKDESQG